MKKPEIFDQCFSIGSRITGLDIMLQDYPKLRKCLQSIQVDFGHLLVAISQEVGV